MIKKYQLYCILLFTLLCCKKPFNPRVISTPNSYLVVEGVINSGSDSTIIKLSKTVKLDSSNTVNPLLGATVSVQSDQNASYPLIDVKGNGYYVSAGLNLAPGRNYRLSINTSDGRKYLSDFTAIKQTPPIDSVGYILKGDSVNLYVNTHDPANNTRYYRWDFDETWLFHAKYESQYVLDPNTNTIQPRTSAQAVYYCFGNDTSSTLLLGSTAKLDKDVVYQSPLTFIPYTSEKVEVKYSILVKQYALTSEEYIFYQNLKKNTEQLGSIFDAEPSEISGNVHNVANAGEPVIGYVSVTNPQSKRIFITSGQVAPIIITKYPYDCEEGEALFDDKQHYNDVLNILIDPPLTDLPTIAYFSPFGTIIGYGYSTPICTDCTLRGTKTVPSFWK